MKKYTLKLTESDIYEIINIIDVEIDWCYEKNQKFQENIETIKSVQKNEEQLKKELKDKFYYKVFSNIIKIQFR